MRIRSFVFSVVLALGPACGGSDTNSSQADTDSNAPVAAVGIEGAIVIGDGPHQGLVQEVRGTQVEVVAMPGGEIRTYVLDDSGKPVSVSGSLSAEINAPEFAGAEIVLNANEEGSFFVGKLPGPIPSAPAQVALTFPDQAVTVIYPQVALVAEAVPLVELDLAPIQFEASGEFIPPHGGTVKTVNDGENLVEVVVAPSGDVAVYAYEQDGSEIPAAEFELEEIEVFVEDQPRVILLRPEPRGFYFTGRFESNVKVAKKAKVEIKFPKPIIIRKRPIIVEEFPHVEVRPRVVYFRPHPGKKVGHYKKAKSPSGKGYGGAKGSGVKIEVGPGDVGYKGGVKIDAYGGAKGSGAKIDVGAGAGYKGKAGGAIEIEGYGGSKGSGKAGYEKESKEKGYSGSKGSGKAGYKDKDNKKGYGSSKGSKKEEKKGYNSGKGSGKSWSKDGKGSEYKKDLKLKVIPKN